MRKMEFEEVGRNRLLTVTSLIALMAAGTATTGAWAQDTSGDSGVDTINEEELDDQDSGDTVVVTGSRVRRDTFTSISPLQVIDAQESLEVGLIDPSQILQQSEAASGQQIDSTFAGLVLSNGPGSETVNLRGLGANRTLLLINGRRMAPAGVEGAPFAPSINLVPGSLVQRYDLLLDGASSVYGSDAVAGVGNIILRKDFEGLELQASGDYPTEGAGRDYTLSAAWGKNTDRGFFGVGVEYDYQEEVKLSDRDFLAGCDQDIEITESGEIRSQSIDFQVRYGDLGQFYPAESCIPASLGRRIRRVPGGLGFVYYTPGETNVGIPNFSEDSQYSVPIDGDGDGVTDVVYLDYSPNGVLNNNSFINEQKRFSGMAYGEYTFEGDMNITPFFEAMYVKNEIFQDSGASQLFTVVPALNPFNPCNPNQPNGVDCGLAADSLLTNPNYIESFRRYYFDGRGGGTPGCFGLSRDACTPAAFGLLNGPLGPQQAGGGVVVEGDRDITEIDIWQARLVGGVRADLPFMSFATLNDWALEASYSYTKSDGDSSRPGIRDDRLHYALGFDPVQRTETGALVDLVAPCTPTLLGDPNDPSDDTPITVSSDVADGCVAVNLFAPSLYDSVIGDFATQAERDYVFDTRDFNTVYEQTVFNAFLTGNLFELPAGDVAAVVGVEYRTDKLESNPDDVARDGLFFGFFSDAGGVGEKWTREAFVELDVPVLQGKPLIRSLDLNGSARWTEDEFYGAAWTYSVKGGWRPFDSLLLKASFGTSFRAPNLRENFLLGTTGFNNVTDPCVTPQAAVGVDGSYNPTLDTRDPITLQNCMAEGIDPTNFSPVPGNVQVYSTEVQSGGALDLNEETSESFTMGAAFEQPWFDAFDLNINVNYYDIEIEDSVISPTAQFILNDCYSNPQRTNLSSPFCSRITREGPGGVEPGRLDVIDQGFINRDKETVTGLDYNVDLGWDMTMWDQPVDFGIDVRANQLLERDNILVDAAGVGTPDSFVGEPSFPEWTGRVTLRADLSDYRFTWQTRYVGDVEQDAAGIDPFSDAFDSQGTGFVGHNCGGPTVGDELCRDVGFADEVFYHTASIRYQGDTWRVVAGVENIFATEPALVNGGEFQANNNAAIGAGYLYDGRQYFLTVRKKFY